MMHQIWHACHDILDAEGGLEAGFAIHGGFKPPLQDVGDEFLILGYDMKLFFQENDYCASVCPRDGFVHLVSLVGFRENEDFLKAFLGLDHGFQPGLLLALDADGSGRHALAERFAAEGHPNDHADDTGDGFDFPQRAAALFRGGLVASAGGHGCQETLASKIP